MLQIVHCKLHFENCTLKIACCKVHVASCVVVSYKVASCSVENCKVASCKVVIASYAHSTVSRAISDTVPGFSFEFCFLHLVTQTQLQCMFLAYNKIKK